MSDQDLKDELERLRKENAALKKGASSGVRMKVSEKGAVSIYGMGRFPVTLYKEQWLKLLEMSDDIRAFIAANEAQLKAVTTTEGPLLIVAGAGTGKTRTLVYRVARLVERGIAPERILLLTFTRRAAREMLHRAETLTGDRGLGKVWGGTFHAIANRLLRLYGRPLGLSPDFTVLDQADMADADGIAERAAGCRASRSRPFRVIEPLELIEAHGFELLGHLRRDAGRCRRGKCALTRLLPGPPLLVERCRARVGDERSLLLGP